VRDADRLGDGDQKYQKECDQYVGFKTDKVAAQSDYTEHEQEDLREVDIDKDRHEGENQDRAEGEKPDGRRQGTGSVEALWPESEARR
jgi:hypothetical protein